LGVNSGRNNRNKKIAENTIGFLRIDLQKSVKKMHYQANFQLKGLVTIHLLSEI